MKGIITVIISTLSLVVGCQPEDCRTFSRTIINNSGKDVEISSFNTAKPPILSEKYNLKNQENLSDHYQDCSSGGRPVRKSLSDFLKGDSIIIDFGDRIKSYGRKSMDTDVRNPYYIDYHDVSNDFNYSITPDDYANATPKP